MKTLILAVVLAVGGGCDGGKPDYKGRSPAEWRKAANDADVETRAEAYRALLYTHQTDLLATKFEGENDPRAKLAAGAHLMGTTGVRTKVLAYVASLLREPGMDYYFQGNDARLILGDLTINPADAAPLLPLLQRLSTDDRVMKGYISALNDHRP